MNQIAAKKPENSDIAGMNLILHLPPKPASKTLSYRDQALLMGSCFADHIGSKLNEAKFQVSVNPTGIVFDPLSLSTHLLESVHRKQYDTTHLFHHQELWHSWSHHSDFSSTDPAHTLHRINEAIRQAHQVLQTASFLFITLGTAYAYRLKEQDLPVANCHKVTQDRFEKRLLPIGEITEALSVAIAALRGLNPNIEVVFTVSPVKHLRDGIIENNRSKARLLEAAHQLTETISHCTYFPAYELVTDVLRDYRFYATDMAHPSEQAIQFVFEQFCETYLGEETRKLMHEVRQIVVAKNHRPLHPGTHAHQQFLHTFLAKTKAMQTALPMLDWENELAYFSDFG